MSAKKCPNPNEFECSLEITVVWHNDVNQIVEMVKTSLCLFVSNFPSNGMRQAFTECRIKDAYKHINRNQRKIETFIDVNTRSNRYSKQKGTTASILFWFN